MSMMPVGQYMICRNLAVVLNAWARSDGRSEYTIAWSKRGSSMLSSKQSISLLSFYDTDS